MATSLPGPHRRSFILAVIPIVLCVTLGLAGCSSSHWLAQNENMAVLKGFSNFCVGRLFIANQIQSDYVTTLTVPPGSQLLRVRYRGTPFTSSDTASSFFANCVVFSEHTIEVDVEGGKRYWVKVNELSEKEHRAEIWEALSDDGPEGQSVPVYATQTKIYRRCYIDNRFDECHY